MPEPSRILLVRPDTYGDWILTEPLIRLLRTRFPAARVALMLRASHADVAGLLGPRLELLQHAFSAHAGVRAPGDPALLELGAALDEFGPDLVLAPAYNQTWLERWVARRTPRARRVALAGPPADPAVRWAEERAGHPWGDPVFDESVPAEESSPEWVKLQTFALAATGQGLPGPPQLARGGLAEAGRTLQELGLASGAFVVCAPAGVTNVPIKAWPAVRFAAALAAWTGPVLLTGHQTERAELEAVQAAARSHGHEWPLWLGADGSFAEFAALLSHARLFLGNDSGAMHAAAGLGVPTLGIFGGGTWPRFLPQGRAASAVVVQPLACFGCGWSCAYFDAPCLKTIPVSMVQQAMAWLERAKAGEQRVFEVGGEDGLGPAVRDFLRSQAELRRAAPPAGLAQALAASEADRAERLRVIDDQGRRLSELEAGMDAALREWISRLAASEADRAARQQVIVEQGDALGRLRAELGNAETRAEASERQERETAAALAAAQGQLRASFERLEALEADRAARLRIIEHQGEQLVALASARELAEQRVACLEAELAEVKGHLQTSESDRAARLAVIEELGSAVEAARREVQTRREEGERLQAQLAALGERRLARLAKWLGAWPK